MVKIKGLKRVQANMKIMQAGVIAASEKGAVLAANMIKLDTKVNIDDFDLINTGELIESVYVSKPIKVPNGFTVEVGVKKKSGVYLEFGWSGQGIGEEMIDNLTVWAVQKLQVHPDEAEGVAWAIAFNLAQYGREAMPFFQNAIDDTRHKIPAKIADSIKKWLRSKFKSR